MRAIPVATPRALTWRPFGAYCTPGLFSSPYQAEVEHDGVVVGEHLAGTAPQPADDPRRLARVGLDAAPREPVELERAAAAVVPERPLDPPEAPPRHPLAHVRVRRQILHVVVERAGARLVQGGVGVAAPLELPEEAALEPPLGA